MSVAEFKLDSESDLVRMLADRIEAELTDAVAARGRASLVLSGGNTPKPLLIELAGRSLPWSQITVTLADERWVEADSEDSNEAMVRSYLLKGPAAEADFLPLKNSAATARLGCQTCEDAIAGLLLPIDVVILGMGEDGHTASLFPGVDSRALDPHFDQNCWAVLADKAPHERITLTAAALLNSRHILLHITGEKKWSVYQQAAAVDYPVGIFLGQNKVPISVFWSP